MDESAQLEHLIDAFFNDGDSLDIGCKEDEIEYYKKQCLELFPLKYFCIVKDWIWFDISLSEEQKEEIQNNDLLPSMIKADHVVHDELQRFDEGDWVRTSLLKSFHQPCFFETRNTVYILVGRGSRKEVNHIDLMSFY